MIITEAAAQAAQVAGGGLSFSWDVNLTTVAVFISGAIAWYVTVIRLGDRVKDVERDVSSLNIAMQARAAEHSVLREVLYKEYLPRHDYSEMAERQHEHQRAMEFRMQTERGAMEERLQDSIRELSVRVDGYLTRDVAKRS